MRDQKPSLVPETFDENDDMEPDSTMNADNNEQLSSNDEHNKIC